MKIAVLLTCYNRIEKTLRCLNSLNETYSNSNRGHEIEVFLTDDGSTDGTYEIISSLSMSSFSIHVFKGSGSLYWNGGMNNSWREAIKYGKFDCYLWLNDDTIVLDEFWISLDKISEKSGILVGTTRSSVDAQLTYGGFNYVNNWTLKDQFVLPNGLNFQPCMCAHGNITLIFSDVVEKMGILCDKYLHGGGDHDYVYLAYKAGFTILVMPYYVGICDNDHLGNANNFESMSFKERIAYLKSPFGLNLNNTLLFNFRCFPYRIPFVLIITYMKVLFPKFFYGMYRFLRR